MNSLARPLRTADLLGLNLAKLLDMHAGTIQRPRRCLKLDRRLCHC